MGEYRINEDGTVTRFVLPEELKGRPLLSDLDFSRAELLAITKLGIMMAAIDMNVDKAELASLTAELVQISSGDVARVEELKKQCLGLEHSEAIQIVSRMSYRKKQYVTAFLITIMAADRKLDERERVYLGMLSSQCKLPSMSVNEALNILVNL